MLPTSARTFDTRAYVKSVLTVPGCSLFLWSQSHPRRRAAPTSARPNRRLDGRPPPNRASKGEYREHPCATEHNLPISPLKSLRRKRKGPRLTCARSQALLQAVQNLTTQSIEPHIHPTQTSRSRLTTFKRLDIYSSNYPGDSKPGRPGMISPCTPVAPLLQKTRRLNRPRKAYLATKPNSAIAVIAPEAKLL